MTIENAGMRRIRPPSVAATAGRSSTRAGLRHGTFASPVLVVLCLIAVCGVAQATPGDTLERVRERGAVVCGVNPELPGFSSSNSLGEWSGLDVDLCRAISSAVFGQPEAVEFVPVSAGDRFSLLVDGGIDVLTRNTTWTLSRNAQYGEFVGVNYYDGQGFMVRRATGIRSAFELDNRRICVSRGTTTELNTIDFFAVGKLRYRPIYFDDGTDAAEGYAKGDCDALTTDRSGLAGHRATLDEPDAHRVLPEVISKEPLGPMVRAGDAQWSNVVRWSLNCMINAEEMGLTRENVQTPVRERTPAMRRLTGEEGSLGAMLGLPAAWCRHIVRDIGNYAESHERNVGLQTPLALERGVNALWTDGGLLYAPPMR